VADSPILRSTNPKRVFCKNQDTKITNITTALNPDVFVVAADHSTPAVMGKHSWHPVPILIRAQFAKVDDVATFDEYACMRGALGQRSGVELMGLALDRPEN
jgi:2,3-bisphosphoglycerate-independent phosphoglycerate mutase